jgi:putative ABC transport system substrate-binding protein
MPNFERLSRRLGGRGLAIVGINAREEKDAVHRYGKDLGLTFPLVLDPTGKINALYGVIGLPTTFLIDRDGRVVALAIGPRNWGGQAAETIIEALLADPSPPRERQRARPVLIGALSESWGPTPAIIGLRDGLAALGYRENEHFMIGVRFTQGNPAELPVAARQLVERGAGILVTGGGGATEATAAQMATDTLPIVLMTGSDPVGLGLVRSLARPGGNITGVADLDVELAPKRLEIFRELVPDLKRVLFPYDADDRHAISQLNNYRHAARRLRIILVERPVRTQEEARTVLDGVRKGEVDGILSPRFLSLNIPGFIIETGGRRGIPTMLHNSFLLEQGGLASYAANYYEIGRQASRLVDKIIKGEKPADIPVEQPTRFELVINRRTARSLGLTIPPSILLRAERLIE